MEQYTGASSCFFTVFHLFSGSGAGALGFQQAEHEYKGITGKFRTLGGIELRPGLCGGL